MALRCFTNKSILKHVGSTEINSELNESQRLGNGRTDFLHILLFFFNQQIILNAASSGDSSECSV